MNKQKWRYLLASLVVIVLVGVGLFNHQKSKSVHQTYFYLGTIIDVTLYGTDDMAALTPISELIHHYDTLLDRHNPESDIYQLNEKKHFQVSDDTYQIIASSLQYGKLSEGYFDITINPIVDLWQIGTEDQHIPEADAIKAVLDLVDYNNVRLDDNNEVTLLEGASIDLGAIAKGFIADQLAALIRDNGYEHALINLGGNVYALGHSEDGTPWHIGVRNPEPDKSEVLLSLKLADKSVVTSGITERYFIEDGVLYHHIFNPYTGYPIHNDIYSISVISNDSFSGDALSTTLYALGIERAFEEARKLKDVQLIIVTKDKRIYASEDLMEEMTLFDQSYEVIKK